MSKTETKEAGMSTERYTTFQMQTRKGMAYYVYDGNTEIFRSPSAATRDSYYARLTAPAAVAAPVAAPAAPAMAPGWSNAARRRTGKPAARRDTVGEFLGVASPARPGDCHYCGLKARTCDCR